MSLPYLNLESLLCIVYARQTLIAFTHSLELIFEQGSLCLYLLPHVDPLGRSGI